MIDEVPKVSFSHLTRRCVWLGFCMFFAAFLFLLGEVLGEALTANLLAASMLFFGVSHFLLVPVHAGIRFVEWDPIAEWAPRAARVLSASGLVALFASTAVLVYNAL